jgi:hypothetical protein
VNEPTLKERLMEALKRDLATLGGPETYISDRAFYEARVACYRSMLLSLEEKE